MAQPKTTAKKEKTFDVPKLTKGLTTVSSKIRALDAAGMTRSEIAKALGKRYQHVRNVLVTLVTAPKATAKA